ncbi:AAA family ATPase [uncultured Pedobacter sp.]|uniref:ATP-dependent nuclease n=1 Tax=uncultured Pedobacter sp. TaxID=246139 RepID=UPI0025DD5DD0|nr:AAA family ATPase [uncultured Pedobacter sp.]
MAKNIKITEDLSYMETMLRPRLKKLIVKNFRCIGNRPVEIDLDDIVVLVGPNNAGKSSILKAYEVVMSDGSKKGELTIEDFPNNQITPDRLPEIELHTIVYEEKVGVKWLTKIDDGFLVKEKWWWSGEGKPQRRGWNVDIGDWDETSFPFGPANIANSRRPEPHKVDAFSDPEEQAKEIKKLLMTGITERVKSLQSSEERNEYHELRDQSLALQKKIIEDTKAQIDIANESLSSLINQVFPNYVVNFEAQPEANLDLGLWKWQSHLKMGPDGGFQSTVDKQGSGARRTLLWTALKYIAETNRKNKEEGTAVTRPYLLLIDEPEICLHPSAIREACKVLYDLPSSKNWQVMVTTHSPIFIDFTRDNTTIVKVDRNLNGEVEGTTIFRPDKVKFDEDDRSNIKLLNACDPYVAEFFFGGKVIVVEGDTEYTAFNYIRQEKPEKYRDIHIIRARGKSTIVSLCKILNHFGASYSILHDSDQPFVKDGSRANPAWTNNLKIKNSLNDVKGDISIRLLASIPNFEMAYFATETKTDKPYNALEVITNDQDKFSLIESLLDALISHSKKTPKNCLEWTDLSELQNYLDLVQANNIIK